MNEKRLVAASYDRIGEGLLRQQHQTPPSGPKRAYLERLTERLPDGAWVLDLGCGPGMQSAWLSERFRVIGVDISREQITLATKHAPRATFLLADMCSLQFRPGSFDAIAAMYSIIHVPREEHAALFASMHRWLKPGGRLLVVLGSNAWEGSESNWLDMGADMWWSHFDADTGLDMLCAAGFAIAQSSIEPDTGIGTGAHLFALAEKPA